MQATTNMKTQRGQSDLARARAIVRFNSVMFHSLATASFLESAAEMHAERLSSVLAAQPEARLWLEQVWVPQRAELGRRLREYVGATWPEFDWNAAYAEFQQSFRTHVRLEHRNPAAALDVVARCVAEVQLAVLYRGLAKSADESLLRSLAREAASAHAMFFDFFRGAFERCKRQERVGFAATWRTLRAAMRSARDIQLRAAFEPLARNWNGPCTVPELTYDEFVQRMAQSVSRYADLGRIERLLFRPWLKIERLAPATPPAVPALPARPALRPA
jgi:hypothetical protein